MKATFIKEIPQIRGGICQKLYRVDPPMTLEQWDYDEDVETNIAFDYVVVSAAQVIMVGPETYIFGADEEGMIVNWSELEGSFKGALDHERALHNAGYEVEYVD